MPPHGEGPQREQRSYRRYRNPHAETLTTILVDRRKPGNEQQESVLSVFICVHLWLYFSTASIGSVTRLSATQPSRIMDCT
jgi:hypothetical protein